MDINVETALDYITHFLVDRGYNPLDWAVYSGAHELVYFMKEHRLVRFEEVDDDVLVGILDCDGPSW